MIYTYEQAEEFLNQFILPPEPVTNPETFLDRFKVFLKMLGNPHEQFQSVIVSGTSGKGSTSFILSSVLTAAGYKTGYTQSPHLEKLTERLQINNKAMSDTEFVDMVNEIIPLIEAMKTTPYGVPSYYEILLAMAFLYFAKERVDIAVVEVGLEGKYDGTNVLSPLGFVLTNISLDHTNILGNTIDQIAEEATYKIKELRLPNKEQKPFVVTGVSQIPAVQLVERRATESGSKFFLLKRDFDLHIKNSSISGVVFDYSSSVREKLSISSSRFTRTIKNLHVSLIGNYQAENAALALATIEALQTFGVKVSEEILRQTLRGLFFPGRFEIQTSKSENEKLKIILDGAHNSAKMQAFLKSLKKFFPKKKTVFIVAFSSGHDIAEMITQILEIADVVVLTQYGVVTDMGKKRSVRLEQLQQQIKNLHPRQEIYVETSSQNALEKAIHIGQILSVEQQEEALLVVTGSLYLVGEVRQLLHSLHS